MRLSRWGRQFHTNSSPALPGQPIHNYGEATRWWRVPSSFWSAGPLRSSDSFGNSNGLVQNLGISLHNRQRHAPSFEPASTGRALPMGAARSCLDRLSNASPRPPPKHANSAYPENGQMAGYVGDSSRTRMGPMEQWRLARPEVQLWNSR